MKVKELIERLKHYEENSTVMLECTYDLGYGTAGGNITEINEISGCVTLYCDEC